MQRLKEIFANNLTVRHVVGFVLRMEGSELSPFFFPNNQMDGFLSSNNSL